MRMRDMWGAGEPGGQKWVSGSYEFVVCHCTHTKLPVPVYINVIHHVHTALLLQKSLFSNVRRKLVQFHLSSITMKVATVLCLFAFAALASAKFVR